MAKYAHDVGVSRVRRIESDEKRARKPAVVCGNTRACNHSDAGLWSLDDDYRVLVAKARASRIVRNAFVKPTRIGENALYSIMTLTEDVVNSIVRDAVQRSLDSNIRSQRRVHLMRAVELFESTTPITLPMNELTGMASAK